MEQNITENQTESKPLTFDEILGDKEYQKEFDRRIAKAINTAKEKWEIDAEAKRTEAEKLAQMKESEKQQYALEKASRERDEAVAKLNAYELKNQAIKIATEKGLDISLLEDIDYTKQTAETISTIIDTKKSVFDKAIEKAMNERYKEKTPENIINDKNSTAKELPTIF